MPVKGEQKSSNPKISAGEGDMRGPRPSTPTPINVPDADLDHSGGSSDAVPIAKEVVPESVTPTSGSFDPNQRPDAGFEAPTKPRRKEPERKDFDPGKPKPVKYKRGVSPGDIITS